MKSEPNHNEPRSETDHVGQDHPQDPQDGFEMAILSQALAAPQDGPTNTPIHDLQQKVLALTDPTTQSLLDETLAPPAPPVGLTQHIIAATTPNQTAAAIDQATPWMIEQIMPNTRRYALAAAVTLVMSIGLGLWLASSSQTPSPDAIANDSNRLKKPVPNSTDDLPSNPSLGFFVQAAEPIEDDIHALSEELSEGLSDHLIDLDAIWSEMDAYEQFLMDIESNVG